MTELQQLVIVLYTYTVTNNRLYGDQNTAANYGINQTSNLKSISKLINARTQVPWLVGHKRFSLLGTGLRCGVFSVWATVQTKHRRCSGTSGTAEVPLSKVLNPEMLIWGPAMNWRLNQGWKTAFTHCVPSTHLVFVLIIVLSQCCRPS